MSNQILNPSKTIYCGNLEGMAYVKNSKGYSSNVTLYTSAIVDTKTNTAIISYSVSVFDNMTDAYSEKFTDYNLAIAKYNELAEKWNGHREM